MRSVENSKMPLSSDVRAWVTPVATLVSVTVAPATTAPELSRTVPTIDPVSNCAAAGAAKSRKARQADTSWDIEPRWGKGSERAHSTGDAKQRRNDCDRSAAAALGRRHL